MYLSLCLMVWSNQADSVGFWFRNTKDKLKTQSYYFRQKTGRKSIAV